MSLSLEMIDYATFTLIMQFKMRHIVLECPLYNSIRCKFPSLIGKGVSSLSQLDSQVDIDLILAETTHSLPLHDVSQFENILMNVH